MWEGVDGCVERLGRGCQRVQMGCREVGSGCVPGAHTGKGKDMQGVGGWEQGCVEVGARACLPGADAGEGQDMQGVAVSVGGVGKCWQEWGQVGQRGCWNWEHECRAMLVTQCIASQHLYLHSAH